MRNKNVVCKETHFTGVVMFEPCGDIMEQF